MNHPSFSRKERQRLFLLYFGRCYLCDGAIDGTREKWDVEHVIPWELSKDNADGNLRLVHAKCHKAKTAGDIPIIRKAQRREAKFNGATRPKQAIQSRGFDKRPAPAPKAKLAPRTLYVERSA